MAEWTERQDLADELVEAWLKERTPYRTPGIHISDIVRSMVENTPGLVSRRGDGIPESTMHAMWVLGLAWEDVVLSRTPWSTATTTMDRITLNTDCLNPVEQRVDECKLTWKSSRVHPSENWEYATQIKGYCWAFKLNRGRFYIYYVNDRYKPTLPRPTVFDVTFDYQELWENWNMLVNHRAWMEAQQGLTGRQEGV